MSERAAVPPGMSEQTTGSGPTTMCAKPPQVAGQTGTWTTVGTMGRVVRAKAIAMGAVECQSGLQCSQDIGASYGFRADYDVCE